MRAPLAAVAASMASRPGPHGRSRHRQRSRRSGEARRGARHVSGIERLAVVPPAIWSAKVQASISGTALADHPMTQIDASVHRAV
jgi:hypothetical protein